MSASADVSDHASGADPELLFETERPGYRLRLWLRNEQMECRADLDILTPPAELSAAILSPAELIRFLQQSNISQTIDFENLYRFCAAAAAGTSLQGELLARGVPPVNGADGWFEMAVKTSGDQPEYLEDEKGNVDLRTQHRFSEIEAGQKLGIVHAPKAGQPGMTAHGLPIPAEPGQPFQLIAGEGVTLKYDDRVAFAEKSGRALFNQRVLSIVDELVIPGDLDLRIGNLAFHGFIEIKGDVPDDFSVKASKGMRIAGAVGACRIESGGALEIGSMAGKEVGQIVCHGDLKAGYLNQTQVACYGNVLVTNEIRNSQVKATGRILVEGAIVGGKCVALEGIEAKSLGATSGLRTQLVAGVYFPDADRFDYLRERLKTITKQLKKIQEAIGPLERSGKPDGTLDKASELRRSILNQQREKLEQEKEQCAAELATSQQQEFSSSNPKINVLKTIKEGVVVTLGEATEEFKIELSGPVTLIENTSQGGLRHLSLSPLSRLAATIEKEFNGLAGQEEQSRPAPQKN